VVDVHVRVLGTALGDERHEALERRALARVIKRPEGRVARGARCIGGALGDPEKVVDALAQRERVALEIDKEIARRRQGQAREPVPALDVRHELVDQLPCPATTHLHARLLADAREGRPSDALDPYVGGKRAELRHLVHAGQVEGPPLSAAEASHERQVVVGPPLRVALPVQSHTSQCSTGSG
jgi:hypothetical protein